MSLMQLTAASGRFAAARRLGLLPAGHAGARLHGHNFEATVLAAPPAGWAPFPGGEVPALHAALQACLRPLQHADLNQVVEQPSDEHIARWIRARLNVPGVEHVAVRSTPQQGVDLDRQGAVHAWRRYAFQAAHRLPHVPAGHKCGRMHGHGFELMLHAAGDAREPAYDRLDRAWVPWQQRLDLSCLNDQPGLENPTSEVLAAWLWEKLQPELADLAWLTVFETEACGARFDGRDYRIWKEFTLDSAVRLSRAPAGARAGRVHGHTYRLRLHAQAPLDTVLGWAMDFGDIKALFEATFEVLDHQPLYEIDGLADTDTGTLARWIFETVQADLPQLVAVDLYESAGAGALLSTGTGFPPLPA